MIELTQYQTEARMKLRTVCVNPHSITMLSPWTLREHVGTKVILGGDSIIVKESMKEVRELMDKARSKK